MSDPVDLQILEAVRNRLYAINPADGYNTKPCVVLGFRPVTPEELNAGPVVLVYELEDSPTDDVQFCGDGVIAMDVAVEGIVRLGSDSKPDALAHLSQDLRKALFTSDTTLGGLALAVDRGPRRYIYPPPGGETVAVAQTVNVLYLKLTATRRRTGK